MQTASPETLPIGELGLGTRASKMVLAFGIQTAGDLAKRSSKDLLEARNFGETSLREVREKLAAIGLKLRGE